MSRTGRVIFLLTAAGFLVLALLPPAANAPYANVAKALAAGASLACALASIAPWERERW